MKLSVPFINCTALLAAAMLMTLFTVSCDSSKQPEKSGTVTPPPAPQAPPVSSAQPAPTTQPIKDRILAVLPEFVLTDQDGNAYGSHELRGKIWIANFMFTRCQATCPAQTAALAKLQTQLQQEKAWKDIRLVSISVDPTNDTPQVLMQYAQKAGAAPDHWKFLTGQRDAVWQLCKQGFKLPVGEAKDDAMPIFHSPKFVLIDPYMRVRGLYDSASGSEMVRLLADTKEVNAERIMQPRGISNPPWMAKRREDQLKTVDQFKVYYDFQFADLAYESGIRFRNRVSDDGGKTYKPAHYDHGNGIAIADVDGDGLLDIYFVSQIGPNALYRNLGGGKFEDITAQAGVAVDDPVGVTASFADVDNDGDPDLYVTTVRAGNVLFQNDGKGKFTDISKKAGVNHSGHSSGTVFFDYDLDGHLDMLVTNVGKYTTDVIATVTNEQVRGDGDKQYKYYLAYMDAFAGHLKPDERNESNILYRNLGDGRFEDVTDQAKLADFTWCGDACATDLNQDGWPDLYILNMQGQDEYYENVEGKYFERKSRDLFPKTPWGAMSIKSFDYDNDGDLDILISDMHSDMSQKIGPDKEKLKSEMKWVESLLQTKGQRVWGNALYRNNGDGTFEEVSDAMGAENYWPWGLSVGDLNSDGFDDVFLASSMNYPFRYGVNTVLLNNKGEKFLDSEFILGVEPRRDGISAVPWFELDLDVKDSNHGFARGYKGRKVVWSALGSRASAIFDLDNDGDLDIVTNEFNSGPLVLISNLAQKKKIAWLKVKLKGTKSNRDGLGATVTVTVAGKDYMKVMDGQSGYLSHSITPLYFGLGDAHSGDKIIVRWPSGTTTTLNGPIKANRMITIKEDGTSK